MGCPEPRHRDSGKSASDIFTLRVFTGSENRFLTRVPILLPISSPAAQPWGFGLGRESAPSEAPWGPRCVTLTGHAIPPCPHPYKADGITAVLTVGLQYGAWEWVFGDHISGQREGDVRGNLFFQTVFAQERVPGTSSVLEMQRGQVDPFPLPGHVEVAYSTARPPTPRASGPFRGQRWREADNGLKFADSPRSPGFPFSLGMSADSTECGNKCKTRGLYP